jgi:hypothetical protein
LNYCSFTLNEFIFAAAVDMLIALIAIFVLLLADGELGLAHAYIGFAGLIVVGVRTFSRSRKSKFYVSSNFSGYSKPKFTTLLSNLLDINGYSVTFLHHVLLQIK